MLTFYQSHPTTTPHIDCNSQFNVITTKMTFNQNNGCNESVYNALKLGAKTKWKPKSFACLRLIIDCGRTRQPFYFLFNRA